MARTPDPTRIPDDEADDFREMIRAVLKARKLSQEKTAEWLGWTPEMLKNHLKPERPLLEKNAFRILCAARAHCKECFEKRERRIESPEFSCKSTSKRYGFDGDASGLLLRYYHNSKWLKKFDLNRRTPRVFIPKGEINYFSARLANAIEGGLKKEGRIKGIGAETTEKIRKIIEKFFLSPSPNAPTQEEDPNSNFLRNPYFQQMAYCWYQEAGRDVSLFITDVASGKMEWNDLVSGGDVLKTSPGHIANETIYAAFHIMTHRTYPPGVREGNETFRKIAMKTTVKHETKKRTSTPSTTATHKKAVK